MVIATRLATEEVNRVNIFTDRGRTFLNGENNRNLDSWGGYAIICIKDYMRLMESRELLWGEDEGGKACREVHLGLWQ